jgi:hypothetical protein
MERDKRIELSPPPWQGGVLPLYESRLRSDPVLPVAFIACSIPTNKTRTEAKGTDREGVHPLRQRVPGFQVEKPASRLIHFQNSSRFHHRRLLLAFGEPFGAFAIDVYATELLAVVVIHCDLPVSVFASSVLVEPAGALGSGFCLRRLLFHDGLDLNARDYRKFRIDRASSKKKVNSPII